MTGDGVERVARFLRLNYRPAPMPDIPWDDAGQDERDAWLAEASHICGLACHAHRDGIDPA